MNKDAIWELIIGSVMIAIVFTLVRPGAPANAAITDVSDAMSSLIKTATDYQVTSPGIPQST